jgi:hypothetical protein
MSFLVAQAAFSWIFLIFLACTADSSCETHFRPEILPMPARGNQLLRHVLCLLAIIAPVAPAAFGQGEPPASRLAALTSRSAAVVLVATLESLSVTTSQAARPLSASPAGGAPSLTVTTSWTIRANCTTLRLSGYSSALAAFARDPLFVSSPDKADRVPLHPGPPTLVSYETAWPAIAQPIGPTSYPGSRTDNIAIAIDRSDNSTSAAPASPLYVLVQAL